MQWHDTRAMLLQQLHNKLPVCHFSMLWQNIAPLTAAAADWSVHKFAIRAAEIVCMYTLQHHH